MNNSLFKVPVIKVCLTWGKSRWWHHWETPPLLGRTDLHWWPGYPQGQGVEGMLSAWNQQQMSFKPCTGDISAIFPLNISPFLDIFLSSNILTSPQAQWTVSSLTWVRGAGVEGETGGWRSPLDPHFLPPLPTLPSCKPVPAPPSSSQCRGRTGPRV